MNFRDFFSRVAQYPAQQAGAYRLGAQAAPEQQGPGSFVRRLGAQQQQQSPFQLALMRHFAANAPDSPIANFLRQRGTGF